MLHTIHSTLKSARVCCTLFLLLLTSFAIGCANLYTTLLTPQTYHFRKARWGTSKAAVLLAEQGKPIHFNHGNTLVFRHHHNDVPVLLVYCFQKSQLRIAGYLTTNPAELEDPDSLFRQELLTTLGEPAETFEDGGGLWKTNETIVYTNAYLVGTSRTDRSRISTNRESDRTLQRGNTRTRKANNWHIVCAYIDTDFYRELNSEDRPTVPVEELSKYTGTGFDYGMGTGDISEFTLGKLSAYEKTMFEIFRRTFKKTDEAASPVQ